MDLGSTIGELQEAILAVKGGNAFMRDGREKYGGVVFFLPNSFSYRGPYFKSRGWCLQVVLLREKSF